MKQVRWARLFLCVGMCAGCASAPLHYYSLTPAPATVNDSAGIGACCAIEIRMLRIPAQVDRPEIVARRSDDQFTVFDNEVWLSPLREEIRSALLAEMNRQAAQWSSSSGAPLKSTVVVTVDRFESSVGRYALIAASWQVISADNPKHAALNCRLQAQVDVGEGVSAMVLGYQRSLLQIAAQMAASVRDSAAHDATYCSS